MDNTFKANVGTILDFNYGKTYKDASTVELYNAVSKAAVKTIGKDQGLEANGKKVCYFSAEFLFDD